MIGVPSGRAPSSLTRVRPVAGPSLGANRLLGGRHDLGAAVGVEATEPCAHRLEEIELVAKLVVERGIRQIAACRHIDVVQHDRLRLSGLRVEPDGEMPRVAPAANVATLLQREGVGVATP